MLMLRHWHADVELVIGNVHRQANDKHAIGAQQGKYRALFSIALHF
jgi:hypothetical protein